MFFKPARAVGIPVFHSGYLVCKWAIIILLSYNSFLWNLGWNGNAKNAADGKHMLSECFLVCWRNDSFVDDSSFDLWSSSLTWWLVLPFLFVCFVFYVYLFANCSLTIFAMNWSVFWLLFLVQRLWVLHYPQGVPICCILW